MIRVKIFRDGAAIDTLEFRKGSLTLGREDADINLPSPAVSRRHARISLTSGGWQIADAGAANGVYLKKGENEPQRIVIEPIAVGDVIIIETFSVRLEHLGDAFEGIDSGDELFQENATTAASTQFISMVDVLHGGQGGPLIPHPTGEGVPVPTNTGKIRMIDFELNTAPKGRWWVRMTSAEGHDRVFAVDEKTANVGRDDTCTIKLPKGPGQLLKLDREGPTVLLERLGFWPFPRVSVDGQRVKEATLHDGAVIAIGDMEITLFLSAAPSND